jgi:hypothetical protein
MDPSALLNFWWVPVALVSIGVIADLASELWIRHQLEHNY